jgi:tripartite-type tricarboxylate transporter receptor subunit TctC
MSLSRRLLLAGLALPGFARAQEADYPNHTVTVINPWPAGGSSDSVTRILVQRMASDLGQPFVVENRPGATGTLGHAAVARARPDGYTLLLGTNSTFAIAPHLYASLPYDYDRAFTPVSLVGTNPQIFCVHPSVPVADFGAFLAMARAEPDKLSFQSSGIGGTSHLATELLMSMAQIRMLHVPYRGGGPAAQALLTGEVNCGFVDVITALPFLRGGQMRALGVSSTTRAPLVPGVPTIAEAGLPGFQSSTDFAMLAPAGVPPAIVAKLYAAVVAAVHSDEVRGKLEAAGIEPVGGSPAEWPAYYAREFAKWGEIIRSRGIRAPA